MTPTPTPTAEERARQMDALAERLSRPQHTMLDLSPDELALAAALVRQAAEAARAVPVHRQWRARYLGDAHNDPGDWFDWRDVGSPAILIESGRYAVEERDLYARPIPASADVAEGLEMADRESLGRDIYLAMYQHEGGRWEANETQDVWYRVADRLIALRALKGTSHG